MAGRIERRGPIFPVFPWLYHKNLSLNAVASIYSASYIVIDVACSSTYDKYYSASNFRPYNHERGQNWRR